MLMLYIFW
ncbi:UDP-2,3-diacylglucosamine hydrolase, partial [Yersinia pestis PY-08]